ncbi:type II toxin-antitoxin system Y4mF family antitoxin [soil metagenome]
MANRTKPLGLAHAVQVHTASDIGEQTRATRKRAGLDQVTAAGLAGVGPRFLGELERGKESVQLGRALQVLERLGLDVWIAPRGWRPD